MTSYLIVGDPTRPAASDLIAQVDMLLYGEPLPDGDWRVLDGNHLFSMIGRVVMRHEIEDDDAPQETGP